MRGSEGALEPAEAQLHFDSHRDMATRSLSANGMNLRRKQELFLDALDKSFKFVTLTYGRLLGTLEAHRPQSRGSEHADILFLDCWVIVDLSKRIRTMIEHTPGLKHNQALQSFLESTSNVPDFRNYIQHLESEARDVAATGHPIWGSVSWAELLGEGRIRIRARIPGRLAKCKGIPVVNPLGRSFHGSIDHVELSVHGQTINLSELVRCIERFAEVFAAALSSAEGMGQRDPNGLIRFEIPEEA